MSLHYIYSNASNSTQDITAYCRLYTYSATTYAKEGAVAHSTLVVDDPDGILDFVGHRRLYTYEDLAAASNRVVHNGFIFGEKVSRGPYRIGAGRIWTLDLVDTNALLNRRLMNGADANRPAETDVQRMSALVGYGPLTPMTELNTVDDTLYFSAVNPVNMDAADYRTQPAGTGYIDDCRQATGKNAFVWYRESLGQYSLWYDFAASSNWPAAIRLSNVLGDVDNVTTFAIDLEQEAELDRDPSRVASGVMLPFDGVAVGSNTVSGTVYVQDATTTATFAAIDWLAPSLNVKTKTMAEARANRYLADADEEDDLITCSVKLPAANVNDILAGQWLDARFSHLPGYEAFSSFRCLSRTVTEISEDPTRAYRLDLELSPLAPVIDLFAILYYDHSHDTAGTVDVDLGWISTGDAPSGGFPPAPSYGPIVMNAGPGSDNVNWLGATITGTGTVSFDLIATIAGVPLIGDVATVSIKINGVVVASEAIGPCVSNFTWPVTNAFHIVATDLPISGTSVITTHVKTAPRSGFFCPAGTGSLDQNFTITGTVEA